MNITVEISGDLQHLQHLLTQLGAAAADALTSLPQLPAAKELVVLGNDVDVFAGKIIVTVAAAPALTAFADELIKRLDAFARVPK